MYINDGYSHMFSYLGQEKKRPTAAQRLSAASGLKARPAGQNQPWLSPQKTDTPKCLKPQVEKNWSSEFKVCSSFLSYRKSYLTQPGVNQAALGNPYLTQCI